MQHSSLRFACSCAALPILLVCACTQLPAPQPVAAVAAEVEGTAEPLEVFERFLAIVSTRALATAEREEFLAGELSEEEFAGERGSRLVCDAIVRIDATNAVARVTIAQPARKVPMGEDGEPGFEIEFPARDIDTYWFLAKTDRWRIGAERALAQTGLLELTLALPESASDDPEDAHERARARLTLSSDRQLLAWFRERKSEIEALAAAARELAATGQAQWFTAESALGSRIRELHVTAVEVRADGSLEIIVGGMTDNTVQLRHLPSRVRPAITPGGVIWAEALGEGWFLVRTT